MSGISRREFNTGFLASFGLGQSVGYMVPRSSGEDVLLAHPGKDFASHPLIFPEPRQMKVTEEHFGLDEGGYDPKRQAGDSGRFTL